MLTHIQITAYLQRIGIEDSVSCDIAGLNKLIRAHLTHVPFENLDIWSTGICPCLDVESLFHKIVRNHRGGYCFELNTLFRCLLNSLGFDAYQVVANLVHEDNQIDPPAHNVIICPVDGLQYVLDVGFGGAVPFGAMPLQVGEWENFTLSASKGIWSLQQSNGAKPGLRFRDIPAERIDLEPLNFYISQKPDSHFRHILRINQRKSDGSVYTLVDRQLCIHHMGTIRKCTLSNDEALKQVIAEYFGILPETYSLR